jgi:hypothetical protein
MSMSPFVKVDEFAQLMQQRLGRAWSSQLSVDSRCSSHGIRYLSQDTHDASQVCVTLTL